MTTPKVDIKLGTAIVQVYEGNPEGLNQFLDSIALFSDSVESEFSTATQEQKTAASETVVRFIKTRLTGKARAAVGDNPQTVEDIIKKLKATCSAKRSPEVFIAKLQETKQAGDINKFTCDVENLVFQLEKAYVSENIPVETATKMAVKQGVKALCSGVRSSETKLLLKAGKFTTLTEAIEKTIENETSSSSVNQNSQMMYARRDHTQRGRGNNHKRGSQGFHGQNEQNNFGNRGGKVCYNEMRVSYNNQTWYMAPRKYDNHGEYRVRLKIS